jgi:hypothetical protein
VDAESVFVLLMLQQDSAASEVHVRLRVDEEDSGIVVEPADGARGELPDQQVCVLRALSAPGFSSMNQGEPMRLRGDLT